MDTWWGRSMVCLSADQFAENLLENNGVDVKRSKFEGRNGILTWKWTLEYLGHRWIHVQMKRCRQRRHGWKFPQYFHAPPPEEHVPEMQAQGVHAKARRIRAFWSEIGRTPGCPACETPGPEKSHTRECKTYQDVWDESRRTAPAEEAKTRNCWRSGHTTARPKFEFNRSQPEEVKNNLCDRERELGGLDECGGKDEDCDLRPILLGSCENEGDWQGRS